MPKPIPPTKTILKEKITTANKVLMAITFIAGLTVIASVLAGIVFSLKVPFRSKSPARTSSLLEAFKSQYGANLVVKWDERLGIPSQIYGQPIDPQKIIPGLKRVTSSNIERLTQKFLKENYSLFKIKPEDLELLKIEEDRPFWKTQTQPVITISYEQKYKGIKVYKSRVSLTIINGKIAKFVNKFYPNIDLPHVPPFTREMALETVKSDLQKKDLQPQSIVLNIYPKERKKHIDYHLAWKIDLPILENPESKVRFSEWTYFTDAQTGFLLEKIDRVDAATLSGTVGGKIYPENPTEGESQKDFFFEYVSAGASSTTTNETGYYEINNLEGTVTLNSYFQGPYVKVYNEDREEASISENLTVPAEFNWAWQDYDGSYKKEESNVFYHTNVAYRFFTKGDPFDITPTPYPMLAYVEYGTSGCNAGAGDGGLYFLGALSGCEATSLASDIIYHEYTHRIVRFLYTDLPDEFYPRSMNEGLADYYGSSLTNDPEHAEYIYGSASPSRNLDNNLRYPRDVDESSYHDSSQIFSGALWDIREVLGQENTDELILRTMKLNSVGGDYNWWTFLDDLLIIDGNGDLSNGTPNINLICHAFYDNHGFFSNNCLGYTESPVAIISSPSQKEALYEETVTIEGTAFPSSSQGQLNYSLEYKKGEATSWSNQGISLTGGEVVEDVLGTWDFSQITEGGFYQLRLTVIEEGANTSQYETMVFLAKEMQVGWPQSTGGSIIISSPALGDLDGDGDLEIVVGSDDKKVYAWHHNGEAVSGWPKSTGGYLISSPALGDLDGDGDLEVVIGSADSNIYAWHHNGQLVSGWPKSTGGSVISSPALGDLDGDGDLEVVVGSRSSNIYAWHHNGQLVSGWPKSTGGTVDSSPALGDLDGDGDLEVVVGSTDDNIYAWHHNGEAVSGWPQEIGGDPGRITAPALGDLDGDGDLEVVVTSWYDPHVYAWHHNGTTVSGWPKSIGSYSSPALGDLDGDGDLEVVVAEYSNEVYAFHHNGELVNGWPQRTEGADDPPENLIHSSPALGDLDGDGDIEVTIGSNDDRLYSWHHNGEVLNGWPKLTGDDISSSPALGDLDGDGDIEVIVGSEDYNVYVWDLPGAYNFKKVEWGTFHHNTQRTGLYSSPSNQAPVLDPIGDKEITAGQTLEFKVTASNPDGDTLNFWVENLPEGAEFSPVLLPSGITPLRPGFQPGVESLTPRSIIVPKKPISYYLFRWTPTESQVGNHEVTFYVSDGKAQDLEKITITVNSSNHRPMFEPTDDKEIKATQTLEFTLTASDPDGDLLTFWAEGLPEVAEFPIATENSNQVLFRWSPTESDVGDHPISFYVSDGKEQDLMGITITVIHFQDPGTLFRAPDSSTIFYFGRDGKKYIFPQGIFSGVSYDVFYTWYQDESQVITVDRSIVDSYPFGSRNVTYRPGTRLIKLSTDPRRYAVEPGGVLREIPEEYFEALGYREDMVDIIPDAFFLNYTEGEPITSLQHPDGTIFKYQGPSEIYYLYAGYKIPVTTQGFTANRFYQEYLLEIPTSINYPSSSQRIEQEEHIISDPILLCLDTDVTEEFPDGKNYYLGGTVSSPCFGAPFCEARDECHGYNELEERYCESNFSPGTEVFRCEKECREEGPQGGACEE